MESKDKLPSAAPIVDNLLSRLVNELEQAVAQGYQPNLLDVAEAKRLLTTKPLTAIEAARSAASEILDFLNFDCENDEVKQDISNAADIISKYFLSTAAATATAAPQQSRSNHFPDEALNRGFPDHISRDGAAHYGDGTVLPSAAPQPKSCGFCGKSDQEVRTLIQATIGYICEACVAICAGIIEREQAAAPVERDYMPPLGYERVITIEWNKHNARRHELIEAGRTRLLSEDEMVELHELQWLAGIKRELLTGPSAAAPVEQSETGEAYYRMGQRESQLAKKILTAVEQEEESRFGKGAHGISAVIRSVCAEEGIEVKD